MKAWSRFLVSLLAWGCVLGAGRAATTPAEEAAIGAIQQASDPSAVITAYANAFALDRNNPTLYASYVSRMVDLGLPEMAYHQAQTLTTLQSNNGLAWGVVAYVDARRAQMADAISAINLAGEYAPDNRFIQHTAGELVAWYDLKADKSGLPDAVKDGLTKVRNRLGQRPDFTQAYTLAQKAYQTEAGPAQTPSPAPAAQAPAPVFQQQAPTVPNAPLAPATTVAPYVGTDQVAPLGYAAPGPDYYGTPYYPDYSGVYLDWGPSYCYDWGPGWVAPTPWCWWQPCGFWGGCDFFPFGVSFAFGDFDDFHHHGFFGRDGHFGEGFGHDGRFGHSGDFGHNGGAFGRNHDPSAWHNGSHGRDGFFGTPARPSAATTQWARAGSGAHAPSTVNAAGTGPRWWGGAAQRGLASTTSATTRWSQPSLLGNRPNSSVTSPAAHVGGLASNRGNTTPWVGGTRNTVARASTITAPTARAWSGYSSAYRSAPTARGPNSSALHSYVAPRSTWAAPTYRAPSYSAPRYTMPSARSFGSFGEGWRGGSVAAAPRSFGSLGSSRGDSSFGGFSRGGSFGGGFHGGGFSGGGFHGGGGGHR